MKRLSPQRVVRFSLVAAFLCLAVAVALVFSGNGWWALLPFVLCVWFLVDAWRARQWLRDDNDPNR